MGSVQGAGVSRELVEFQSFRESSLVWDGIVGATNQAHQGPGYRRILLLILLMKNYEVRVCAILHIDI